MVNTIKTFGKANIFTACMIALMVQVGCGKSSSLKTSSNSNFNNGFGSIPGGVNPADFGFGLNDNNNNQLPLPSGGATPPSQFTQPSDQLGGMSPWAYLQALLMQYQGSQQPAQQDLRAIIQPGQYAFRFGPTNQMGSGYSSYQYQVQIPATVTLITSAQGAQCAQSLTGTMSSSIQICLNFSQPSLNSPLPIRVDVTGPQYRGGQTLWVMVVGQPRDLTGYKILVASASGPATAPPVVIRHGIYQNDSNSRSSYTKIGSDIYVDVVRGDNAPVSAVQTLTAEPLGSATVSPTGTPYRYIVRPLQGGPITLVARGTDTYGNYEARSPISVPRQLAAIWTRSDKANVESSDRIAVVCSNMTDKPVTLSFSANTQFGNVPMFLPPYAQNVRSQVFQRVLDPGFSGNSGSSGSIYTGNATLTVEGNVPVGAISCYGLVYDCDPSNDSECFDKVKGNHFLGRGGF